MSLAVVFKSPEGIVLAADSRVTLMATGPKGQLLPSYFDNATKLLSVEGHNYVGIATYGQAAIGQTEPRTAHGYLPEFEAHLAEQNQARFEVEAFARELGAFYLKQWTQAGMPVGAASIDPMVFLVAGFDPDASYGRVFEVKIPNDPDPVEQNPNTFGVAWGGQGDLVNRLVLGVDPEATPLAKAALGLDDTQVAALAAQWRQKLGLSIPYQFLPLQDCVDLSTFLVNMTATVQTWTVGVRGVGGEVDVATITRTEGFRALHQKRVQVYE